MEALRMKERNQMSLRSSKIVILQIYIRLYYSLFLSGLVANYGKLYTDYYVIYHVLSLSRSFQTIHKVETIVKTSVYPT